ncbi:hypothetical protein [uncultured Clostridium sp.]|uniref:hypothetical protein n=1 Tax=uncultured Clostridium sp. TaxID=59620 RepID=UPI00263560E6|nr:hypothetical protein [uncultured Clostridium sp.]
MLQKKLAKILEEEMQILEEMKDLKNQIFHQTITECGLTFQETIELIKSMGDGQES